MNGIDMTENKFNNHKKLKFKMIQKIKSNY